jgi:hypothetical protein
MYFVGIILSSSSEKLLHFSGCGWKGKGVNSTPLSEALEKPLQMKRQAHARLGVRLWRGLHFNFPDFRQPHSNLRKF